MSPLPGGALATRPLHFIWICDASASMSLDGKMQSLNNAIKETLPHMRKVADENSNATVLVRTLRFSKGATWVQTAPVPLENFQWTDLTVDELPQTAAFSAEFKKRLEREEAKSGDVQFSLMWNNFNDLDLHAICPSGELIYFGHRQSECGGELDVDMNVSPTSEEPVENIYWPPNGAPLGHYQVLVNHYKNHGRSGCQDPTSFKVAVSIGGRVQEFTDSISHGEEKKLIYEFDLDESLATASGGNTDIGTALTMVAEQLKIPPMTDRALPPVLVLLSDGIPTDDYEKGLRELMAQPWGKKAVRIAIAIGQDVEEEVLQQFIDHPELKPLQANNPQSLMRYIKWASTAVLQSASSPAAASEFNIPIAAPPNSESGDDIW